MLCNQVLTCAYTAISHLRPSHILIANMGQKTQPLRSCVNYPGASKYGMFIHGIKGVNALSGYLDMSGTNMLWDLRRGL